MSSVAAEKFTAEKFTLNAKNAWYVLRNSWFMPESFYSAIVFAVLITFIFIMIIFFHYNSIQRRVKTSSRCYQNKMKAQMSGLYSVTATDGADKELYRVTYDIAKKQNNVECACEEGETVNIFRDVKVYNMSTGETDTIAQKYCNCKFSADAPGTSVYFTGHPGLVRFMNSGDNSFFTNS